MHTNTTALVGLTVEKVTVAEAVPAEAPPGSTWKPGCFLCLQLFSMKNLNFFTLTFVSNTVQILENNLFPNEARASTELNSLQVYLYIQFTFA